MGKITSFLVGALAGATVALAFAPNNGEQNRALVMEKANAFASEAKDFGAGFPGSAQDMLNSAVEQGSSLLKGAQDKTNGLVGDGKVAVGKSSDADADELREKIEAARQRIAAQVMENAEKAKANASETVEAAAEAVEEAAEEAADKADEAKHAK